MMTLTCVRHGRTAWNADGRFQGQTDVPLDDTGRDQARHAAARLAGAVFDAAVSSDLSRAAETAAILLQGREIALRLDRAWREMSFGEWEGRTWAQIEERAPEMSAAGGIRSTAFEAPGGEAFGDLCARVAAGLGTIRAASPPLSSVLIVAHAGPLHALLRVLDVADHASALGVKFLPASVSRFVERDGRWEILALNTVEGPIEPGPAGLPPPGT